MSQLEQHPDLTRAALPLAVLALLSRAPMHGYALVEALHQHGFTRLQGGTLYPLLKRLEDRHLVTHAWDHSQAGPGRKTFTTTPAGEDERRRLADGWDAINRVLADLDHEREDVSP